MKRKEDKKEGKIVETEAVSGAVAQKDEINRDEKKDQRDEKMKKQGGKENEELR